MANAPLRQCSHGGCRQLIRDASGRCEAHRKPAFTRQPDRRLPSSQRGYDADWWRVRALKLVRDPLCEDCTAEGVTCAANEVHHVRKVADHPELRLDIDNLRSLCTRHHSRRTRRRE
jgi:5-methylcytosine-specific restriction enzyme A